MRIQTLLTSIICLASTLSAGGSNILWYDKPAGDWQKEALPLGNGSLGCMIFGDPAKELIQFNHDTMWIGGEEETGAYQAFGEILIKLNHKDAKDYRRELDLSRAVHTITYTSGDTEYRREYFASHPAQVMVFRLTANKEKSYTGSISLSDAHDAAIKASGNRITAVGDTSKHQTFVPFKDPVEKPIVLDYESQVLVIIEGGTVEARESMIDFSECNSLTIICSADTNYVNKRSLGWTRDHPHERVTKLADIAASTPYEELLNAHIDDYQSKFSLMSLDLGSTDKEKLSLSTDLRMKAYRGSAPGPGSKTKYEADAVKGDGEPDVDLEELMFNYSRYLMISCSRSGSLPSNLQGLWNNSNGPEWRGDYHSDVNLQMNYWFVDHANIPGSFDPFADWLFSILEVRREQTMAHFNKRGFAMRVENGIFGGGSYRWSTGDASWLANNIWDHYRYTLDLEYLETRAYPILKELFMFWEDHLKEIPSPDGEGTVLVSPDGWSPEHGPKKEDGVSFEQQLAWDLLNNFSQASEILGVDEKERKKAIDMRDNLMGPRIGKWGQLMEWIVDRDDPDDKHRHLSHLIAVHPGRQISPITTPKLAEAAKVSMNARGDGATGWSKAWKINMWARLHDGNRAHKLLTEMLQGNVYDNLLCAHPPFQIDGNFGYGAGVCEMLLQSHTDQIHLLPALPEAWATGSVKGIRARGAFGVDMQWEDSKLTKAIIKSDKGTDCVLRASIQIKVTKGGKSVMLIDQGDGVVSFATEAGGIYVITPNS